jgi:two-component system phosphate regulon response regulator PhoB
MKQAGFQVRTASDGEAALAAIAAEQPDLMLLDVMMPRKNGYEVCQAVRANPEWKGIRIIMLTAKGREVEREKGLALGADDYITKPFDLDVLLARIAARLRRTPSGFAVPSAVPDGGSLSTGDLILDRDAHVARTPSGEVPLNPKEYDLLELLLSRPGHLFPREEIVERVWRQRYMPASRSLDVHVRRLRVKLEGINSRVELQTVRGVGYRLTP